MVSREDVENGGVRWLLGWQGITATITTTIIEFSCWHNDVAVVVPQWVVLLRLLCHLHKLPKSSNWDTIRISGRNYYYIQINITYCYYNYLLLSLLFISFVSTISLCWSRPSSLSSLPRTPAIICCTSTGVAVVAHVHSTQQTSLCQLIELIG